MTWKNPMETLREQIIELRQSNADLHRLCRQLTHENECLRGNGPSGILVGMVIAGALYGIVKLAIWIIF